MKTITPKITTLVAELKIIKIGNKQFTLSVFDQLYEGECHDKNYNIIHKLWGKVRRKNDIWIVFQESDKLRKQLIVEKIDLPDFDGFLSRQEFSENGNLWGYYRKLGNGDTWGGGDKALCRSSDFVIPGEPIDPAQEALDRLNNLISFLREPRSIDEEKFPLLLKEFCPGFRKIVYTIYIEWKLRIEKRNEMVEKMNNLDQLFIAV